MRDDPTMTPFASSNVWKACSALLDYVENASATQPMTPRKLLRHLDAIALAMHDIGVATDDELSPDDDEPTFEKATYDWVGKRGPFLAYYNSWWPKDVLSVGEVDDGPSAADACDDVMDVVNDLRGARAWLEAGSPADAQLHLSSLYFHWGQHLRDLQTFLWSLLMEHPDGED